MVNLQLPLGPIQIMTIGLDKTTLDKQIIDEIIALEKAGTISLLDATMIVRKAEDDFQPAEIEDKRIAERPLMGAFFGSLVDLEGLKEEFEALQDEIDDEFGEGAELDDVDEDLLPMPSDELLDFLDMLEQTPVGGAVAVLVLHHQWAIPLVSAIRESGGFLIADEIAHADQTFPFGLPIVDEDQGR